MISVQTGTVDLQKEFDPLAKQAVFVVNGQRL
jgi:hypothetical protein